MCGKVALLWCLREARTLLLGLWLELSFKRRFGWVDVRLRWFPMFLNRVLGTRHRSDQATFRS